MSGSIGGNYPGGKGGDGGVLVQWIATTPGSVFNITVGAGGNGETNSYISGAYVHVPGTAGGASTVGGPGGVFATANGGTAAAYYTPGTQGTTTPVRIWNESGGYYLYGVGGLGGQNNSNGSPGAAGAVIIEWVD